MQYNNKNITLPEVRKKIPKTITNKELEYWYNSGVWIL